MTADTLLSGRVRTFYEERGLDLNRKTAVGFSGGADSTALLLTLHALGVPATAVHVCHNIRGETAERDARFCRTLCERVGIPFIRRDVHVLENLEGRSVEEAARHLRYEVLAESVPDGGYLAIAHNANDAVETALFNLARGTGAQGLGIVPERPMERGITLIRPLIRCTREEILETLAALGESFTEDETNACDCVSRNILRHACIPAMQKVNPKAVENAAAALERLREDHEILMQMARELAHVPASAKALREAPKPIAARAFLMLIRHKDVTEHHIEALHALCETSKGSGSVSLPGKLCAVREYDEVRIVKAEESAEADRSFDEKNLKFDEPVLLEQIGLQLTVKKTKTVPENSDCFYNIYVDSGAIHGILSVRPRRAGDVMRMRSSGHTKPVKKALIDAHIPRSLRDACPVIVCGDEIAAVRGLGASADFAAKPGTDAVCICFEPIPVQ